MNVNNLMFDTVRGDPKCTREYLATVLEPHMLPSTIGATITGWIRKGVLVEQDDGTLRLNESAAEADQREREQRKAERDRPKMPPASPTAHVAPVASKARPGSHPSAVAICAQLQAIVDKHGPIRASDLNKRLGEDLGTNLYYHLKAMTERGELLKRGALYGTSPAQFEPRAADLSADTPTAPIVDVPAAVADAEEQSRPQASPFPPPGFTPLPPKPDRVRSIADLAAKHAPPPAPGLATATVGGFSITVVGGTPAQAVDILSAALRALP